MVCLNPSSPCTFPISLSMASGKSRSLSEGACKMCRRLTYGCQLVVTVGHVSAEVGDYTTWMKGERLEALGTQPLSETDGEEDVGCLRLTIRPPFVVRFSALINARLSTQCGVYSHSALNSPESLCHPTECR